jgi:UDP-MurNAc hydroxylase
VKITMLGHASLMVETDDVDILFDPVLWDPHQEGMFAVCPARAVHHARLPAPDVIVVSHQHMDHFDVRSLASLPRTAEVICPRDPVVVRALGRLGYRSVLPTEDWTEVEYGKTRLLTTPSECPVPEFGVVVRTPDAVLWNQVDTVVNDSVSRAVRRHAGSIDLLIAPWQPMLETAYQWGQPTGFPFEEYEKILQRIEAAAPAALVPGANGFRFVGASEWLNRVVFPVTRERFQRDVAAASPALAGRIFPADPGDEIVVNGREVSLREGASPFVRRLRDDRDMLDFRPNQVEADLVDANEFGHAAEEIDRRLRREMEEDFPAFLRAHGRDLFLPHRAWGVVYQLVVVHADRREWYAIDFSAELPALRRGRDPRATMVTHVAASSLYRLAEGIGTWSHPMLGGSYRTLETIARVTAGKLVRPRKSEVADPLWLRFRHEDSFSRLVEREISRWSASAQPPPAS